jgi:hypothetical protein
MLGVKVVRSTGCHWPFGGAGGRMQRTIAGSYGIAVYLLQVQHTHTRPRGAVQQPKEEKSKGGKSLKALADGAPLTVHYTIHTHFGSALWPQSVLNNTN